MTPPHASDTAPVPPCAAVNKQGRTIEGIDTCGDRLAQLIIGRTAALKLDGHRVVKLSLFGYSLGGLICR